MKEGFMIKSGGVHPGELDAISGFARRTLSEDEVYVFSVVLCDNEVDRDGERFTVTALEQLSGLFVGKTGLFDHSMKGKDQTARIFSAAVETVPGKETSYGEPYCRLVARAYIPRLSKNADLIEEIEMGIKKEVSVGCAIGKKSCSVCGADPKLGACAHQKGRRYPAGGKEVICHTLLEEPQDAYEWSFVAVPAQPMAGVTKSFSTQKEELCMVKVLESIRSHEECKLSKEVSAALDAHLRRIEEEAEMGRVYRKSLCKDVVRLCALADPKLSSRFVETLTGKMSVEELQTFKSYYESRAQQVLPVKPQLAAGNRQKSGSSHSEFKI